MSENSSSSKSADDPMVNGNDQQQIPLQVPNEFVPPKGVTLELCSYYGLDSLECRTKMNRNCRNNPRCLNGLGQPSWLLKPKEQEKNKNRAKQQNQYAGLNNLGATCYLNTFLQLWFHNEPIRRAIYQWHAAIRDGCDNSNDLIVCLQLVFGMMQFSLRSSIDPSPFIKSLKLNEDREEDVHEFSSLFLGWVQNQASNGQDNSVLEVLRDQFLIKLDHIIQCNECGQANSINSEYYELSLRVKNFKSLDQSLDAYFDVEEMVESNRYRCQRCMKLTDARRWTEIRQFPKTLQLQLLRFESHNGHSRKINTIHRFPKILDLSCYTKRKFETSSFEVSQVEKSVATTSDHNGVDCLQPQEQDCVKPIYALHAVLVHQGQGMQSGHYITYIKPKDIWYQFNDKSATRLNSLKKCLSSDEVNGSVAGADDESADKPSHYKSKNAYMLVFKLIGKVPDTDQEKGKQGNKSRRTRSKNRQDKEAKKEEEEEEVPSEEAFNRLNSSDEIRKQEMEKWNLPEQIQESIMLDNSVYSADEHKEQVFEEEERTRQHEIREILKTLWECMPVDPKSFDVDLILQKWLIDLFEASSLQSVPEVDNGLIMCPHDRLDKNANYKVISPKCADIIYDTFGGGPRFKIEDALCHECYDYDRKLRKLKEQIEEDHKRIALLVKFKPEPGTKMVWVGSQSFRGWRSLAINNFTRGFPKHFAQLVATKNNCSYDFNSEIFCEHGNLTSDATKRRLVVVDIWEIFMKYFDLPITYFDADPPCPLCSEDDRTTQALKDTKINEAKNEKMIMKNFYEKKIQIKWADILRKYLSQDDGDDEVEEKEDEEKMEVDEQEEEHEVEMAENNNGDDKSVGSSSSSSAGSKTATGPARYHLVSGTFYQAWRKAIGSYGIKYPLPALIENSELLCPQHQRLLFPVGNETFVGYESKYVILPQAEWNKLRRLHSFDVDIVVEKRPTAEVSGDDGNANNFDLVKVTPPFCKDCFNDFLTEQEVRKYIYTNVPIFILKVGSDEEGTAAGTAASTTQGDADTSMEVAPQEPMGLGRNGRRRTKKPRNETNGTESSNTNGRGNNDDTSEEDNLLIRRSSRKRKHKDTLQIIVSSTDKLKEVKAQIMQHFSVATFDQILILDDRTFTSQHNNMTLAELEIVPEMTIILKVDDKEQEEFEVPSNTSECGFKGTAFFQ